MEQTPKFLEKPIYVRLEGTDRRNVYRRTIGNVLGVKCYQLSCNLPNHRSIDGVDPTSLVERLLYGRILSVSGDEVNAVYRWKSMGLDSRVIERDVEMGKCGWRYQLCIFLWAFT